MTPELADWLRVTFAAEDSLPWPIILGRSVAAAVAGMLAAGIYAWTHRRDETFTVGFLATLVLLSILVATATQVIGQNAARAFGLVGALAIVRFRTVVEDTRDTAFVMLAVMVGMAAGAGHLGVAATALVLCGGAAAIWQERRRLVAGERWSVVIRTGVSQDPATLVMPTFDRYTLASSLTGTSTARQGAAIEMSWIVTLRPGASPTALVAELNRIEGVQNVELRRQ